MKKLMMLSLLFLSLNGLYAMEEPTPELPTIIALRQWCDEHGGESCARLLERGAKHELAEVRRVREWRERDSDPLIGYLMRNALADQDRALRLLWLLQEAGYPSEAQRS